MIYKVQVFINGRAMEESVTKHETLEEAQGIKWCWEEFYKKERERGLKKYDKRVIDAIKQDIKIFDEYDNEIDIEGKCYNLE